MSWTYLVDLIIIIIIIIGLSIRHRGGWASDRTYRSHFNSNLAVFLDYRTYRSHFNSNLAAFLGVFKFG